MVRGIWGISRRLRGINGYEKPKQFKTCVSEIIVVCRGPCRSVLGNVVSWIEGGGGRWEERTRLAFRVRGDLPEFCRKSFHSSHHQPLCGSRRSLACRASEIYMFSGQLRWCLDSYSPRAFLHLHSQKKMRSEVALNSNLSFNALGIMRSGGAGYSADTPGSSHDVP